ncbi:MAG: DUF63 family protein [Candidatus Aenigmatarchaeota archaeon]
MFSYLKNLLSLLFLPQPSYTFLNTFVYAVEFLLASYLFFLFLKKLKIKIDAKFATSISPFILLGSCLRVLEDLNLLNSIFFVTPLIYLTIGSFLILALILSLQFQKKFEAPYFKLLFFSGFLPSALILSSLFSKISNFYAAFLTLIFSAPWLVLKFFKWSEENKFVLFIHAFDATVTFVGINYFGYKEMHVLPKLLISSFSPISFIFFKALTVFSILMILDKFSKEKEMRNFIKLMIGMLGASTAIRDFLRVLILI